MRLEVAPEQRIFVATAPVTVAQSMFEPASEVFGLWDGAVAVGLIGMIDFTRPDADLVEGEAPDNFYLWRLLIDQGQQRQGYGSLALRFFLDRAREKGFARVTLTAVDAPGTPIPFYERYGFTRTGQIIEGEVQMALVV
ncbi:MAG: hypothetical protein CME02_04565, partial [Geminicoccus sp.]|nr:hypothetical protein [Geminicoccus sp.]